MRQRKHKRLHLSKQGSKDETKHAKQQTNHPPSQLSQHSNLQILDLQFLKRQVSDDAWVEIFCMLDAKTWIFLSQTCQYFYKLTNENNYYQARINRYWKSASKSICKTINPNYQTPDQWKQIYIKLHVFTIIKIHITPQIMNKIISVNAATKTNQNQSVFIYHNQTDYMSNKTDITPKMRLILIDWLIAVHRKFDLKNEVLFDFINILDKFLSVVNPDFSRNQLQLAGCCAFNIACDYHYGCDRPEIEDYVYMSDNAFTDKEFTELDKQMLSKLGSVLTIDTPLPYARKYMKIVESERYCDHVMSMFELKNLLYYLMELCLLNYELSMLLPRQMVAACLAYILTRAVSGEWPQKMADTTGYTLEDLFDTIQCLHKVVTQLTPQHDQIITKYSKAAYSRVAMLEFEQY